MNFCIECRRGIGGKSYLCVSCFRRFINEQISTIRPSEIEDCVCEDIFPDYMVKNMSDFLVKDINETLECLEYELWTATVLMSARLLESQLKIHINHDLGMDKNLNSIGQCIDVLTKQENRIYTDSFLDQLDELRDLRNSGMHGSTRFGSREAIDTCKKVFAIIGWIYNIPS